MRLLVSLVLGLLVYASPFVNPSLAQGQQQPAAQQKPMISDDWLEVVDGKFKIFLAGAWTYEISGSPEGVHMTLKGGKSRILLTIQSIEGKKEASPEKLQKIFEENIVPGSQKQPLQSSTGVYARYVGDISGQVTVSHALFVREQGTSFMVYAQGVAEEIQAEPDLEKLMASTIQSFAYLSP